MNFNASAWTRMPLLMQHPAATLTFDLKNLIRSSVGASKDSLCFIEIAQAVHEISW